MMKLFSLSLIILLLGCNPAPTIEDVKHPIIRVHVSEDPTIKTDGVAYTTDTECAIVLKQYPICLLHEVRHCLEGKWHDGESSVDCY